MAAEFVKTTEFAHNGRTKVAVLAQSGHVHVSKIDEEAVILDLERGVFIQLNRTAAIMWDVLTTLEDRQMAVMQLSSILGAELNVIERDVADFVVRLEELGLVQ
jgi:hypothetical protein